MYGVYIYGFTGTRVEAMWHPTVRYGGKLLQIYEMKASFCKFFMLKKRNTPYFYNKSTTEAVLFILIASMEGPYALERVWRRVLVEDVVFSRRDSLLDLCDVRMVAGFKHHAEVAAADIGTLAVALVVDGDDVGTQVADDAGQAEQ